MGSNHVAVIYSAPVLNKELLDIQATTECRFTLKCVSDMIGTHSQHFMNFYFIFYTHTEA